jgi:hypothetical protein
MRFTNFKLLRQIKENSIHEGNAFKLMVSTKRGHCDYSPRAPTSPDTLFTTGPNRDGENLAVQAVTTEP